MHSPATFLLNSKSKKQTNKKKTEKEKLLLLETKKARTFSLLEPGSSG